MKDIGVKTEKIQLDQFFKWADLVEMQRENGFIPVTLLLSRGTAHIVLSERYK